MSVPKTKTEVHVESRRIDGVQRHVPPKMESIDHEFIVDTDKSGER